MYTLPSLPEVILKSVHVAKHKAISCWKNSNAVSLMVPFLRLKSEQYVVSIESCLPVRIYNALHFREETLWLKRANVKTLCKHFHRQMFRRILVKLIRSLIYTVCNKYTNTKRFNKPMNDRFSRDLVSRKP